MTWRRALPPTLPMSLAAKHISFGDKIEPPASLRSGRFHCAGGATGPSPISGVVRSTRALPTHGRVRRRRARFGPISIQPRTSRRPATTLSLLASATDFPESSSVSVTRRAVSTPRSGVAPFVVPPPRPSIASPSRTLCLWQSSNDNPARGMIRGRRPGRQTADRHPSAGKASLPSSPVLVFRKDSGSGGKRSSIERLHCFEMNQLHHKKLVT